MKPGKKSGLKWSTALAILLVGFAIYFGPFIYYEIIGERSKSALNSWSKDDCETVWNAAKKLSVQHPEGSQIEAENLPKPMRVAGFKTAFVDATEFHARHGGSSFGSVGALVICNFESTDGIEPGMGYSGGRYTPDGRWEKYR